MSINQNIFLPITKIGDASFNHLVLYGQKQCGMPFATSSIQSGTYVGEYINLKYFFDAALKDIKSTFMDRRETVIILGLTDIKQRYRRSKLGPFWITISMSLSLLGMGLVFGTLLGAPLKEFLPFLALGLILWSFISGALIEACTCFIEAEALIKQIQIPLTVHALRTVWRNILIFLHNIVLFPLILLIFSSPLNWHMLLFIPGLALLLINMTWIGIVLAVICTRYRDMTQIITSLLQLCFFITPIVWQPQHMIEKGRAVLMDLNPFFHLIEVVRAPLLGNLPTTTNWSVCVLLAFFGSAFAMIVFGKYQNRIAYWL